MKSHSSGRSGPPVDLTTTLQGTVHKIKVSGTKSIVRHGTYRASDSVLRGSQGSPDTQQRHDSGSQAAQNASPPGTQNVSPPETTSPSDIVADAAEPVVIVRSPASETSREVKSAVRIALQYYMIQDLAACALSDARETYRHVRSNFRRAAELPAYIETAMRAGIMYNQAKNWHLPVSLQLGTAMIGACQRVRLHKDWAELDPLNLSPAKVLVAMSSKRKEELQLKLTFRTGLWQGRSESIQYFSEMKQRSGYIPVVPVFIDVLSLNSEQLQQIQEKRYRQEDCKEEEMCLALNFSEHWALNLILTMTDYSDPAQNLPFSLPQDYSFEMHVWRRAMDLVLLTHAQLQQFQSARQHLQIAEVKIEDSNKHLHQICEECFSMAYDETTVDAAILDTLECLRRNQLDQRMMITEAGFVFLFKILSPSQAAIFYGYIQTQSRHPIAHFLDWMNHLYKFMTGREESKWMDTYGISYSF